MTKQYTIETTITLRQSTVTKAEVYVVKLGQYGLQLGTLFVQKRGTCVFHSNNAFDDESEFANVEAFIVAMARDSGSILGRS